MQILNLNPLVVICSIDWQTWLYAGFDYSQLSLKHHLHHQHPASDRDPDFHDGKNQDFWLCYWQFVREHHQPPQLPWW